MWWDQQGPEEQERWLRAQREAQEIKAGNFVCPWCQRYVDPAEWWTHIDARPYEDVGPYESSFGATLFHHGCAARVPEKNVGWVKALRKYFRDSPIKPGDYVRFKRRVGKARAGSLGRVIDIKTDEYAGVTDEDPYYQIDISVPGQEYQEQTTARRDEVELAGRPYLKC